MKLTETSYFHRLSSDSRFHSNGSIIERELAPPTGNLQIFTQHNRSGWKHYTDGKSVKIYFTFGRKLGEVSFY